MNILIVDDEVFTVRAIQTTLNWEKLGIDRVFSAYNAAKAREIIGSERIDLMICDIEMPKEDGLSLVTWLREQEKSGMHPTVKERYMMEVIFLTCHSEFEYARKALKLQVFDYVVKPVNFEEMEKTIEKAVDKIRAGQQKELKTQMGEYWLENKKVVEERFWKELLCPEKPVFPEEIEQSARMQNIDFDKDRVYRLVLISIKKIKTMLEQWNDDLLLFTMQNIAKELILKDLYSNRTLLTDDRFVIIAEDEGEPAIRALCEEYVTVCKRFMGTSVFCYISNGVFCEEFSQTYNSLCQLEKNDVAGSEEIVFDNGSSMVGMASDITLPDALKESLFRDDGDGFMAQYHHFIDNAVSSQLLNYTTLKNIQQDLLQCFFVYMERKRVLAHEVSWFNSENVESVEQLNRWVKGCVDILFRGDIKLPLSSNEMMIGRIKSYILEHLGEDINRESIAAQVNLSPDYMAKIFKSVTGKTLSQFIIDERMEKAVLLMRTTRLNISQIAVEVGCANFSYFSKLFKKHTGMTPREYRL